MEVGSLAEVWRYPVKSLRGERLSEAPFTLTGITGDRCAAVIDVETGNAISGKRLERLLSAAATTGDDGVRIAWPDGSETAADDPSVIDRLTDLAGRPVTLALEPPAGRATIASSSGTFESAEGRYHDTSPIHLVTSATLAHLATLYPEGNFDRRRFRPNLFVESGPDARGPVEQEWLGATIRVGSAEFDVVKPCKRCIMTTSEQEELPKDRVILGTIERDADSIVGLLLRPRAPGSVRVGDRVSIS